METSDAIGPLGAKSMSESPFNPVAPAFANALRNATGIRFTELPVTRDVVWRAIHQKLQAETPIDHTDAAHRTLSTSQMRFHCLSSGA